MESKNCKICFTEKKNMEFKPHRKVCRKCDSKMNYEKYKDKFKEYYIKDKIKELNIKRNIEKKISDGKPKNKIGRPRSINVKPLEERKEE